MTRKRTAWLVSDCEYGMVPNCYGVYCRCLARYMEPDGFCSLAKRRVDR